MILRKYSIKFIRGVYCEVYVDEQSSSEEEKVPFIIESLYNYFKNNYRKMPTYLQVIANEEGIERAACDYIAGMSDQFATSIFKEIFIPKSVKVF